MARRRWWCLLWGSNCALVSAFLLTLFQQSAGGREIDSQNARPWARHTVQRPKFVALRGGIEPPLVEELFELGFDKNLYTRATFYNEKGQRIPPPKEAFSPGPEKYNWAEEEMEAMVNRVRPDEWPDGHPGYNGHPFAGVKRPGWFLEEYIEEESSNTTIQGLNRALWQACSEGDAELANALLHQGAQVNAGDPREEDMWTALFYCCAPPPAAGLPDAVCNDTALVVEEKRLALVDCLLAHGALVQARDIWGETPLHYAAVRGYPNLCRKLINVGVDIHATNMYGCTAQRQAVVNSKYVPSCSRAAQVIEDAGGDDIGNPDQDPCEATDDSIPKLPRIPRDSFRRLGGIPPFEHLELDASKPGFGRIKPEIDAYLQREAAKKDKMRKQMERDLILKHDGES
jgi:hypothetical protein